MADRRFVVKDSTGMYVAAKDAPVATSRGWSEWFTRHLAGARRYESLSDAFACARRLNLEAGETGYEFWPVPLRKRPKVRP